MAAAQARTGFWRLAAETGRRAGVYDLGFGGQHISGGFHQMGLEGDMQMGHGGRGRGISHRPPLGPPFRQPTIQHCAILQPHQAKRPPDACGGKDARAVINHGLRAIADAQGAGA
jgi:hypothetical protein